MRARVIAAARQHVRKRETKRTRGRRVTDTAGFRPRVLVGPAASRILLQSPGKFVERLVERRECAGKLLAARRQLDPTFGRDQQLHGHLVLKPTNLSCHLGVAEIQTLGGIIERSRSRHFERNSRSSPQYWPLSGSPSAGGLPSLSMYRDIQLMRANLQLLLGLIALPVAKKPRRTRRGKGLGGVTA
jgi:hypothetical protein